MMLTLDPMVLELYRQITCYVFSLEADEKHKTGRVTQYPELKELVNKIWSNVWTKYDQLHVAERAE